VTSVQETGPYVGLAAERADALAVPGARVTKDDLALLTAGGYEVEPYHNGLAVVPGRWILSHPDIGESLCGVRTCRREIVADGLRRVAEDERRPSAVSQDGGAR